MPTGIVTTAWPSVGETCRRLGATFDPWQDGAGKAILGKNRAGLFAADAVTLSIPRQVGKTYLVGWIVIGLCLTTPKTLAVWTAHHSATAADTFRDLKAIVQQAKVAPFVRSIYDSGARLEIVFVNGSRIVFGAREHGFGRGFKKVGVLIFDEAQILTARAADDMVPTTNRHANPLIFYMGTPPKPTDPSEHFTELRKDALGGQSNGTLYLEFSADPDADPLDKAQWAKANPSYPHHTTARAMMRMFKNLKGERAFEREALGIWDDDDIATGVLPAKSWADALDVESTAESDLTFALDVGPERTYAAVAVAGQRPDDDWHIEITSRAGSMDARAGVEWVIPRFKQLAETFPRAKVAVAANSAAASFVPALEELGFVVEKVTGLTAACGFFYDQVLAGTLHHLGQQVLDDALRAAVRRDVGDNAFVWWRRRSASDISPLYAVTLALWQAEQDKGNRLAPINNVW